VLRGRSTRKTREFPRFESSSPHWTIGFVVLSLREKEKIVPFSVSRKEHEENKGVSSFRILFSALDNRIRSAICQRKRKDSTLQCFEEGARGK
jgi:hypothetical protein